VERTSGGFEKKKKLLHNRGRKRGKIGAKKLRSDRKSHQQGSAGGVGVGGWGGVGGVGTAHLRQRGMVGWGRQT